MGDELSLFFLFFCCSRNTRSGYTHLKEVSSREDTQSPSVSSLPNERTGSADCEDDRCSRFVFNHFLEKWNTLFEETGNGSTYPACSAELTQLKKELHWLKEVDSISLQSALRHLDDAFSCLQKKQNNKPKFKSKTNPFSPIQPNLRTGTSRYGITTSSCRNWGWYVYRTATRSMAESSTRRSAGN